jgi:benzoylformate decarboxylase
MLMNVRDAFYEVLRAHGITTIFGNPGRLADS